MELKDQVTYLRKTGGLFCEPLKAVGLNHGPPEGG